MDQNLLFQHFVYVLNINDTLYGSNIRCVPKKKTQICETICSIRLLLHGLVEKTKLLLCRFVNATVLLQYSQCFTLYTERPKGVMAPNVPYLCVKEYYYGM
jgi:hypothetical protein